MTTEHNPEPNVLTFEAPASWNTRYLTPDGFECQLTLRGESGMDLLERVQGAISFLLKNGCQPCTHANGKAYPTNGNGSHPTTQEETSEPSDNGNGSDRSFCPIHHVSMKKWEKDGRVWYSHKVGDQWCSGKAKR